MKELQTASLVLLIVLTGCITATLTAAGAKVKSTVNPETVRGCQSLGVVTATSGQGGLFGKGAGAENVDVTLKNKAAKLGGNMLLVADARAGYGGASGRGEAYKCPTTP